MPFCAPGVCGLSATGFRQETGVRRWQTADATEKLSLVISRAMAVGESRRGGALALVKKFGLVGGGQMRLGFHEILLCAGYIAQFVSVPL